MAGSNSDYSFSYIPEFLKFSQEIKDKLSDIFLDGLMEFSGVKEIDGITLIRYDGSQPLTFSMNKDYFEYLKTMGETIASLEPVSYFQDLSRNFEYRGEGHIDLEDFDLFLAKLDDDLLMGVLSSDTGAMLFQVAQKFADKIYETINPPEVIKTHDDGAVNSRLSTAEVYQTKKSEEKKPKIKSKTDLKMDLRNRLDKLKD